MHNPPSDTPHDTTGELRRIAQNVETYRADLGTPKAQFLRTFPDLGSDKTYNKITAGDFSQLDIEAWREKYARAWEAIQNAGDTEEEALIESLSGPAALVRAYLENRNERSNARFVLVLGDSGLGKTSAVKVMQSKPYGANVYELEACDAWKDKQGRGTAGPLLLAIGERLGMTDLPSGKAKLLKLILAKLKERRVCLVIEEVHHLCPQGVNTLKTLINLSPVVIIATGLPILWQKLAGSRSAWAECKQLTGNRLAEKIELTLMLGDVAHFIACKCEYLVKAAAQEEFIKKAAANLHSEAITRGNLKFVSKVCEAFRREVAKGQDADLGTFTNVITSEKRKR